MGITLQGAGGHDGVIMRGAGVQTVFQRRFGRRTQVTARASYDELRYARVSDYNGPRGAMSLGVQHILSPRLKISGALNLSHHHTQAEFHRRTDASVTLGTEISFGGGLITGLEANLGHIKLRRGQPAFAAIRRAARLACGTKRHDDASQPVGLRVRAYCPRRG